MPVVDSNAMADLDIADAYEDVLNITGRANGPSGQQGGPWVDMLRLRNALSTRGWDREKQDRELLRFLRERKAFAVSESNRKIMTQRQIDAQLLRGGNTVDLISLKDWHRPR